MRCTSITCSLVAAGFAEVARVRRRAGARGHRVDAAEAVAVFAHRVAIGGRFQEARDAEADQESAADEQSRTAPRERVHVVEHVPDALVADLIRKAPHL